MISTRCFRRISPASLVACFASAVQLLPMMRHVRICTAEIAPCLETGRLPGDGSQSTFATNRFNLHTQEKERDDSAWAFVGHLPSATLIPRIEPLSLTVHDNAREQVVELRTTSI